MIYIIIIVIGIFLSLGFDGKCSKTKEKYVNLYILILIFISAISDNLGADACTYRERFDSYYGDFSIKSLMIWISLYGYMPLWTIVNELAVSLGCSYTLVQTMIALTINSTIGFFIKKNTDYPFITLLIYFFVSYAYLNFEVQREAFAIGIGFSGIVSYLNGNKKRFWICSLIAILFHISAVCLLFFPFIPQFKLNWGRLFIAFCVSLLMYIASDFLAKFVPSFSGSLGDKVGSYVNHTVTIFGFLLHIIRRMFVPFVSYLVVKRIFPYKYEYIKKFIPFYLCFSILACAIPGTFRFINYMIPISIIIMSDLMISVFKRKIMQTYLLLSVLVMYIYINHNVSNMVSYFPMSGYHRYDLYIPYSTVFDDYKDYSYRKQIHEEALSGKTKDNERKK